MMMMLSLLCPVRKMMKLSALLSLHLKNKSTENRRVVQQKRLSIHGFKLKKLPINYQDQMKTVLSVKILRAIQKRRRKVQANKVVEIRTVVLNRKEKMVDVLLSQHQVL